MSEQLNSLKSYLSLDKKENMVIQIIVFLFTGFTGGLWGKIIDLLVDKKDVDPLLYVYAGVSTIVSVILFYFTLKKSKFYPETVVDGIDSSEKLKVLELSYERKGLVHFYVNEAIKALNLKTCPLTGDVYPEALCDNPLEDGIKEVLTSLIQYTHHFLDCDKNEKFTIAISLIDYPIKLDNANLAGSFIDYERKTLILKDDFSIEDLFCNFIHEEQDENGNPFRGEKLDVHIQVKKTFNNFQFYNEKIRIKGHAYQLITVPIPFVCFDDAQGSVLIVCNSKVNVPPDIEDYLLIFNRIVANWLSKYEDCIQNRGKTLTDSSTT